MILIISMALLIAIPRACDLVHGNVPMSLYGQAIDQNGQPAARTTLTFAAFAANRWRPPPFLVPFAGDVIESHASVTTRSDGTFELHPGWGFSLQLKSVEGGGYSQGCLFDGYDFALLSVHKTYTELNHRATFLCWNDAFKRVVQKDVTAHLRIRERHDLTYRDGTVTRMGDGDENLHFKVSVPAGNPQPPFNWEVKFDTDRLGPGGIVPCDGPLGPETPENGYQEQLLVRVGADDPHWSNQITRRFYTESGHRTTYAGVEATVALDPDAQGATVTFKYSANFGNSRDLVPGPIAPSSTSRR